MILVQESIYQEFNLNKIDSGLTATEDQIRLLQICDSLIFRKMYIKRGIKNRTEMYKEEKCGHTDR